MTKPLSVIYKNFLQPEVFPDDWKKGNKSLVHIKNSKQIVKNYPPLFLLPICSKIFEKLIFDSIYEFINKNIFSATTNQDSELMTCIHQLIAITHIIFSPFHSNCSFEGRGVFFDLSKAFDRVWHDGLLYKGKSNETKGKLFKFIESLLNIIIMSTSCSQQSSSVWKSVPAGVPQCSVLGLLVLLNDLPLGLTTDIKLFTDDISLFSVANNASVSASSLNNESVSENMR